MLVRQRRGRDDQRVVGVPPQQVRDLTEVVRHQIAVPGLEGLPGGRREEVRDVPQVVTELAVDVAPFPQRVHLVDPHAGELSACSSRVSTMIDGSPLAFGITMSAPGSTCCEHRFGLRRVCRQLRSAP